MKAQCPECSTHFQLPDEKVPDRPFKVRCPKCQHVVALPGRGETAEDGQAEIAAAETPPAPAAPARRAHTGSDEAEDSLIAIRDAAQAEALTGVLGRLDYNVDVVEDVEEGARLLEQGAYAVAITSHGGASSEGPATLAQRMLRLTPDSRRGVFVVLVGEFTTGDGTQAWATQADLVLSPQDAGTCENLIRSALAEKKRLYQPYLDARRRVEAE